MASTSASTTTPARTSVNRGLRHRRPRRSLVPRLVPLVIWAGAAGVLALWWSDTTSVVGPAGWLTGAGRITGLLAGYACAVLLALMARVPLLDHSIGTDRLARWHALGGRCTVSLALAHTLLIIWGYSLTAHTGVVSQGTDLVLHYPDLLKGTAGFLLFLATGVLSARAARRRMSYEKWHFLHFATYLAVFLTFFHQLSNGADFVGNQKAQLAWYALFLGVGALVLVYRFVLPVRRGLRHRLRVSAVRPEAPGVVSVHFTGRYLTELGAEPGQFFRWRFLAPGLWWTANPYSLSAPAEPHALRITVKAAGGHSAALAGLRPGTRVWAEGPYGSFTARRRDRAQGAAARRWRRHHAPAGPVRDAAGAGDAHPPGPGQSGPRAPVGAGRDSRPAPGGRALSRRRAGPADRRAGPPSGPAHRPHAERSGARSGRARGLSLRSTRHDGGRDHRPARCRGAVAPYPPRVVRALRGAVMRRAVLITAAGSALVVALLALKPTSHAALAG